MTLRAGALSARLVDGELRHVRWGGREVLRRLAVVVRDDAWGTVAPELEHVAAGGFTAHVRARCRRGALDCRWELRVRGDERGRLEAVARVEALSAFDYNRIGLILLHPPGEVAGRPFRTDRVSGRLPDGVAPQLVRNGLPCSLFGDFDALELELDGGIDLRARFSGDRFEMEDQRNWADGSFKTYSTPLARGFPHRAEAGRPIEQQIRLEVVETGRVEVAVGGPAAPLPEIGVALTGAVPGRALEALRSLRPAHVRLDAPLDEGAVAAAAALRAPVELATAGSDAALDALAARLRAAGLPVARVLCPPDAVPVARSAFPGAAICGAAGAHFVDLNRERPDAGAWHGVALPIAPQAHGSDDDTLIEALEGLEAAARTAGAIFGGLPVHASPVTLKPRQGPGSQGGDDPRHRLPFGAAWTVGALAALGRAGAASATWFEATGPRGLVEDDGTPLPVHEALVAARRLRDGRPIAARASDPLAVAAAAAHSEHGIDVLVANLRPEPRLVRLDHGRDFSRIKLADHETRIVHLEV